MFGKGKAKKAEAQEAPKRKKRHPFRKLVGLAVIGTGVALAVSEKARNTVLDKLFGSEEEFQYTPPTPSSGDDAGNTSA
jgi:hypothetical protein